MTIASQISQAASRSDSKTRILILGLILFLSTIAYADRSILSISAPGIKAEFGLSTVQLGYILSAFSWAYVLGQIPGGLLLDRFGTKRVYGAALVLWSVATFLIGMVGTFSRDMTVAVMLFIALRFAVGLIEGPSFPANARVAVMWFPKEERGRATSLFASASYFAVGIFSPISGWLVSAFDWPAPFFALGALGVLAAFVWAYVMQEPRKHPGVSAKELDYIIAGGALVDIDDPQTIKDRTKLSWSMVGQLLSNRMLWCAYLGQYCVVALSYFFITWFPIYLVQGRGMNIMQAGAATFAPSVAGFLGGIFGGYVSDLLIKRGWSVSWSRKTPYILGMLLGASLVFAALAESNVVIVGLMTLAFFGKGVATGAGTWAVVSDTAPRDCVGLAGSIFNCVGNIAGIITPIVFGYMVQSSGGYSLGLYFVASHCLVAALVYLFVMGKIERVGGEVK